MNVKKKTDYPIVLTAEHVQEIMACSSTSARQYINVAAIELRKSGKLPPTDVIRNSRIPRDLFFEIYGI